MQGLQGETQDIYISSCTEDLIGPFLLLLLWIRGIQDDMLWRMLSADHIVLIDNSGKRVAIS